MQICAGTQNNIPTNVSECKQGAWKNAFVLNVFEESILRPNDKVPST